MKPVPAAPPSLARQFAGATAALAATAVMLVAAVSWWWIDRLHQESARELGRRDVELRAAQIRDTLVVIDERLHELARSPLLQSALTDSFGREAYLLPYLGSIQAVNGLPIEVLLVDFQGRELGRNGATHFSDDEQKLLRGLLTGGRPEAVSVATAAGSDVLFSIPVLYARTGTIEGAIWARLRTDRLLRDPGYRLVTGGTAAAGAAPRSEPGSPLVARVELPAVLSGLDFAVLRDEPIREAEASRNASGVAMAAMTLLLIAAAATFGRYLARRLTADLRALQQFAGNVAERGFGTATAPETGAAEVAGLAKSLNRMLARLNQQHENLQDAARQQLHLLAACIANLNDVVMITEPERGEQGHRIIFVNEAFTRLTGYSSDEVLGKSPRLLQGPLTDRAELDRIAAALASWQPVRAEVVNYRKDRSEFRVEMDIVPVKDETGHVTHWVSVERDVTSRHAAAERQAALEAQIREAQKTEAIGTLAAGIAHDFNNILAAILGNLALARQDLSEGQPAAPRLDQIERSARRARSLIEQILSYSRRQDGNLQRAPLDLKSLLAETMSLLRATVPAGVKLQSAVCDEPAVVIGDSVALEQVLMNLGTNAWHALDGGKGEVTYGIDTLALGSDGTASTRGRPPAAPAPALPTMPPLPSGLYAHVWVADDGCGMDPATQTRIFEPFFTTKPAGRGTGLGLSVVQGIVRAHGGAIGVVSAPGAGTVFHLLLPLGQGMLPADAAQSDKAPERGSGQRVLYVDDDEVMLSVAEGLLAHWGYRVTVMRDASEAIAAVRDAPATYDLVVTDFNMPGLSGVDVLLELHALRADLPVVLVSGYLAEETRSEAVAAGAFAVLRKEHLHEELAPVTARALQQAPGSAAATAGAAAAGVASDAGRG